MSSPSIIDSMPLVTTITGNGLSVWFTLAAVLLTIILATMPIRFVIRALTAKRFKRDQVRILTFANQKGGVGKTATTMMIAKKFADKHPQTNVLVCDCSVFGDVTGLVLGDQDSDVPLQHPRLVQQGATVEAASTKALKVHRSWLPSFLTGGFAIRRHIAQINTLGGKATQAKSNLWVMTNLMDEDMEFDESELSDKAISVAANTIRQALARDADAQRKNWVVLVDTDGGTKHTLTQVALCLADYIVIPTDADVKVIKRIKSMLRFVQKLRRARLSTAEVGMIFFNMIASRGEPNAAAENLGLPFNPQADATLTSMQAVVERLQALQANGFADELSCILPAQRKDRSGLERTFGGIRKGGKDAVLTFDNPWTHKTLGDGLENDIDMIIDKMDALITRDELAM